MWTTEITISFVPLPKEKEEAYWAAIHYLAQIMFADLLATEKESEVIKKTDEQ
jgi:hypothetical protein